MRRGMWVLLAGCAGAGDSGSPAEEGLVTGPLLEAVAPVVDDATSCGTYLEERCVAGALERCTVHDAAGPVSDPPQTAHLAFLRDRYQDLYHVRDASGLNRETRDPMPPGTDELVWGDPAQFRTWEDHGDAAYYMGYFTYAAASRYAVTGTHADYERMVDLTRRQLLNWRVTGVPGYMFRAPFGMLPEGVAVPEGHPELGWHGYKERSTHVVYPLDETARALLPDHYHGTMTVDGQEYTVTATAEGSPSLDAYSGALLGLLHARDLLQPSEQEVVDTIDEAVRCHVNRYKKLRIRNVQDSPQLADLMKVFLARGVYAPDPDDIDLGAQEDFYGYVLEAVPPPGASGEGFEWGCPDGPPREVDPDYDLDASDGPAFIGKILDLALRMQGQGDRPIDFVYFTSLRGGDAVFMMNLAIQAWYVTGDDRYLDFLEEDLVAEQSAPDVANTIGSFQLPDWCDDWIGSDLVHPIVLAAMRRTEGSDHPVPEALARAMREEYRNKALAGDGQSWFLLTHGAYADASLDPALGADREAALADIAAYIQHPDHPDDPKRAYTVDYLADPEAWVDPRYPSAQDQEVCGAPVEVFGVTIEGEAIDPDEALNRTPVPSGARVKQSQIWHFNPFLLGRDFGGRHERSMEYFIDYTAPYWVGRSLGDFAGDEGLALGWTPTDEGCP